MRRFVLLLLLCVLPLQFSLAVPLDAIEHADGDHHHGTAAHSHEITAESTPDAVNVDESSLRMHSEGGSCHHHHSVAMFESSADFKRPVAVASIDPNRRDQHYRSATSEPPERPNWSFFV